MLHISAAGRPPPEEALGCCYSGVLRDDCTCWEPVHDLEQQPARGALQSQPRASLCTDCACRPDSPERREDRGEDLGHPGGMASSWDGVQGLAHQGRPFYCHGGMRRIVAYKHPCGATEPAPPHQYDPPHHGDVPLKADGTAADVCAGWAALSRAQGGGAR